MTQASTKLYVWILYDCTAFALAHNTNAAIMLIAEKAGSYCLDCGEPDAIARDLTQRLETQKPLVFDSNLGVVGFYVKGIGQ